MQNNLAIHSNANIRCFTSDMIVNIHYDATYISGPKVKSKLGVSIENKPINMNGKIYVPCEIPRMIGCPAAEAKPTLFSNTKKVK